LAGCRNQPSRLNKEAIGIQDRQLVTSSELSQAIAHIEENRVREDENRSGLRAPQILEHSINVVRT
jgi:hypothetical protein